MVHGACATSQFIIQLVHFHKFYQLLIKSKVELQVVNFLTSLQHFIVVDLFISIHPSIYLPSTAYLESQQSKQRSPDFPDLGHLFQVIQGDTQSFPG